MRCKNCFKPKEDHNSKTMQCPTLVAGVYRKTKFEPKGRRDKVQSTGEHD